MTDGLSTLYQDLLGGSYDCVDRIVLNAYFRMGHDPGGFRVWWRALTGSDETLENAYLMRLAGRFSRRIRGYAKASPSRRRCRLLAPPGYAHRPRFAISVLARLGQALDELLAELVHVPSLPLSTPLHFASADRSLFTQQPEH